MMRCCARQAVTEIESGQFDADLGGRTFKQRIAKPDGGKSAGWRTLLALKSADKAFFIYGFAKNERDNTTAHELKSLKEYAKELFALTDQRLSELMKTGSMREVSSDETIDP